MSLDSILERLTAAPRRRRIVTRITRTYLRHAPWAAGKHALWDRVVEPYLAWNDHPFVVRTTFGARLRGNTRDLVQQFIYYFGVWEPAVTGWIARQLAPGDTFVDVGANIGYYALLAAGVVGREGKVIAIEASPGIFRELEANLALNRSASVTALHIAAAAERGKLRLYRSSEHNIGETTSVAAPGFEPEEEVDAAPLAEIVPALAIARLVKLDIEGAEAGVIGSLRDYLPTAPARQEWIVELHPELLAQQGRSAEEILRAFADAGFHAYRLENECWAHRYIPPLPEPRAPRFTGPVDEEMNLVFSRRDAESV